MCGLHVYRWTEEEPTQQTQQQQQSLTPAPRPKDALELRTLYKPVTIVCAASRLTQALAYMPCRVPVSACVCVCQQRHNNTQTNTTHHARGVGQKADTVREG